jgi:hypothetical protein
LPPLVSSRSFRKRAVILLDELAEFLGDLVGAREDRLISFGRCLAPERVLEPLQSFGDERLQALELGKVLVHAVVVQRAKAAENLIELLRIEVALLQQPSKLLPLSSPAANLIAELPNVITRELAGPLPRPSIAPPTAARPLAARITTSIGALRT